MTADKSQNGLFIGLMSGTSLDGIDCVICDINNNGTRLKHQLLREWPAALKANLQRLIAGEDSLQLMLETDQHCAAVYAETCLHILKQHNLKPEDILAIGSHGQTIRHAPNIEYGYSTQIGNPSRISEITGITTVADFRNRDIAAGGQGAPLAPAFHQALFCNDHQNRVVVNIGGIANLTLLKGNHVIGYDTGPGNRLLDDWIKQSKNLNYDKNGEFAASGQVNNQLLESLLSDDYFQAKAPKSTGSDYFNLLWLSAYTKLTPSISAADVQATLSQLTATTISQEIKNLNTDIEEILVCGGGVHNQDLLQRLQNLNPKTPVLSTAQRGVDPDWLEAMAFAWLAWRTINKKSGNLPAVTGADGFRICGGIYQR